jgi:hypothetical protein
MPRHFPSLRILGVTLGLTYALTSAVVQAYSREDECGGTGSYRACELCGCHKDHEGGCIILHGDVCKNAGPNGCDWHPGQNCAFTIQM